MQKVNKGSSKTWDKRWKKYWQNAGKATYELPVTEDDPAQDERNFLTGTRSLENEAKRLARITLNSKRIKMLLEIGPAVTVFGCPVQRRLFIL